MRRIKLSVIVLLLLFLTTACYGKDPVEECKELRFDLREPKKVNESTIMMAVPSYVLYSEYDEISFFNANGDDVTNEFIEELRPVYTHETREDNDSEPNTKKLYKIYAKYEIKKIVLAEGINESYERDTLPPCD